MRIFNFQFSIFNEQKGFTLIEMLASIIVLMAIGSSIGVILFTTLRGSNKTTTISNARTNGDYAISQISKMVRQAQTFNGVSIDNVTYSACAPTPTDYNYLKITSVDGGQTIISCAVPPIPTPASSRTISSNSASLLDTTIVQLTACRITCTQNSSNDYPIITINFTLKEAVASSFVERTASGSGGIPFQTTIIFRNTSN